MYSYSHLHSCIHKHKITISPIHSPHRTNKRSINAVIRLFFLYCLSISLSMFEKLTCVYLDTIKIIAERSCECCLQRMNTCGYLLFFSINVFFSHFQPHWAVQLLAWQPDLSWESAQQTTWLLNSRRQDTHSAKGFPKSVNRSVWHRRRLSMIRL